MSLCRLRHRQGAASWALAVLLALAGCAARPPADERIGPDFPGGPGGVAARQMLADVARANADVRTFKGVGTIRVGRGDRWQSFRAAWTGVWPDRLRLEVLFAGRPAFKIACDGSWLYLLNLNDARKPYRRLPLTRQGLEALLTVPLPLPDLIALLAGRVAVGPHSSVAYEAGAADGQTITLVARRRWSGTVRKIELTGQGEAIRRLTHVGTQPQDGWEVRYEGRKDFGRHRIPTALTVHALGGGRLAIRIDRFEAGVPVSDDLFRLRPPA